MKSIVKSQPTRKKLWWLVFLLPILYVLVDTLIYPIDERALLGRTEITELRMESAPMAESEVVEEASSYSEEPENGNGWKVYDRIWIRVERAWPLFMSAFAFFYRKKLVGDKN